ncbi:hypothetical protein [Microlunatus soli]|uniref:hypothetical protein n=1 Tax=Microlunatus soli TaxID=630515 RepID=UPI000B891454|nr:hypothetical protein [Microlunatus soli]
MLLLVCEIVALVVVLIAARGGARTLAAIGIGMLIVVGVLQSAYSVLVPRLMRSLDLSAIGVGNLNAGIYTLFALILAAALILIAFGAARTAGERRLG